MKPLERKLADARAALEAARTAHQDAVLERERLDHEGSDDPLAWSHADGSIRVAEHQLRHAEREASRLEHCARIAATLPSELNGQRWCWCPRNDMVVAFLENIIRPNGDVIPGGFENRVYGTDFASCRPDETSLVLLTDDDAAAIHAGTWEAPRGEEWYRRIAAQYALGRRQRYEAKLADIEANRPQWEAQGIAYVPPRPPQPIPPYDPRRDPTTRSAA